MIKTETIPKGFVTKAELIPLLMVNHNALSLWISTFKPTRIKQGRQTYYHLKTMEKIKELKSKKYNIDAIFYVIKLENENKLMRKALKSIKSVKAKSVLEIVGE